MSSTILDNIHKNQIKSAILLNSLDALAKRGYKDSKEFEMINVLLYNLNFETIKQLETMSKLEDLLLD